MSKKLFSLAGILAAFAVMASIAGIWTSDQRWLDTCGTISILTFVVVFAGIFTAIWEI